MKKTYLIIILLSFTLFNYRCTSYYNNNITPFAGQVYFYTPNTASQLYLFSQVLDFGNATVISDFNENIPLDSLLLAQLPITSYDNDVHTYEFIVKKIDVENPIAKGNITIEGENITVETITGVFEIDTTFVELDSPIAIIKIDE